MNKIILVVGGFDLLNKKHIEFLQLAKTMGDKLVVGIYSDEKVKSENNELYFTLDERKKMVRKLKAVDGVLDFNDTVEHAIKKVKLNFPSDKVIFAGEYKDSGMVKEYA